MIQLKNGQVTKDGRLAFLPYKDERSRLYKAVDIIEDPKIFYRDWFPGIWLDQQAEGSCFPAGTKVTLKSGIEIPIEDVKIRDEVITAEGNIGIVTQNMNREATTLVELEVNRSRKVQATKEHPILTRHKGYIPICDIYVGEEVAILEEGRMKWGIVTSSVEFDFKGTVYNLHVLDDNSYIANGIGVHNCVGHSLSQELATSPVRYLDGIDDEYAFELYHLAQHRDPWPGCHLGMRCHIEPSRVAYEGTSLLAGLQILKERGKIQEYRWAFGEEDLARSVANLGPAVIGVPWYDSMYEPNPRTNYISPSGRKVGGHAIMVAGIDPDKGRYKLWNSWGMGYGVDGWAYITREDMARLLQDSGEAAIPIKRVAS